MRVLAANEHLANNSVVSVHSFRSMRSVRIGVLHSCSRVQPNAIACRHASCRWKAQSVRWRSKQRPDCLGFCEPVRPPNSGFAALPAAELPGLPERWPTSPRIRAAAATGLCCVDSGDESDLCGHCPCGPHGSRSTCRCGWRRLGSLLPVRGSAASHPGSLRVHLSSRAVVSPALRPPDRLTCGPLSPRPTPRSSCCSTTADPWPRA